MIKYHFARGNQGPQNPKDFDFVTAKKFLNLKKKYAATHSAEQND